ncbi:MAG: ABC transporter substrate-binding protein [Bacteroidota bacterium]
MLRKSGGFVMVAVIATIMAALPRVHAAPITVRYATVCTPAEQVGYQALVDRFNQLNPDVQVVMEVSSGGWQGHREKVLTQIAGDKAPDIIRVSNDMFPEFQGKGLLASLTPYIKRAGIDLKDYVSASLKCFEVAEELYAFPLGIKVTTVAYNADLFEKYGVAFPTKEWRWSQEFRNAARKLTRLESDLQATPTYGTSDTFWDTGNHLYDIVWSYGGEIFSEDFRQFLLGSPKSLEAVECLWAIQFEDRATQKGSALTAFMNGQLAMWHTGIWELPRLLKEAKFTWGLAPKPQGPAGRAAVVYGSAYAICSQSKNKDAAWRFIQFVMSPEGQRVAAQYLIEGFPLHTKFWSGFIEAAQGKDLSAFVVALEAGRPLKLPPDMAEILAAMNKSGWQEMRQGIIPPKVALAKITPAVNAVLQSRQF